MNTLVEIVNSGTALQKQQLIGKMILDGASVSAAYTYITGKRRPMKFYRQRIAQHVKTLYGLTVTAEELFPEK